MTPEQRIEEIDYSVSIYGDSIKRHLADEFAAREKVARLLETRAMWIEKRDALLAERADLCAKLARDAEEAAARRKSNIAWTVFAVLIAGAMFIPLALVP